jgi:hypothetical protein
MTMAKSNGLRLVIELSPSEADAFRRLAKTDDITYYEGIAKSLVLGMGEVVNPQHVYDDIGLLVELSEYGFREDLGAQQKWADELSFTRQQLEDQSVKDAIRSWVVYFGGDITDLINGRRVDHTNQVHWSGLNARVSSLLKSLRDNIKRYL